MIIFIRIVSHKTINVNSSKTGDFKIGKSYLNMINKALFTDARILRLDAQG